MLPLDSPWTLIEGRNNDGVLMFRHRQFPSDFPKASFPHRLNVVWTTARPHPGGMPDEEESTRMAAFEDRLVAATKPDCQAVLSLVLTGKGQREFVFHTRSPNEFRRRLTEMPQEAKRYPIEVHHTEDAEWEYVDRVLRDLR